MKPFARMILVTSLALAAGRVAVPSARRRHGHSAAHYRD